MENIVLIVHVLLAAGIIALVLMQQGKGAEAGAAFGGGASQTVFGSQGTGSLLGKITGVLAFGLFVTSFALAVYAKNKASEVTDAGIPTVTEIQDAAAAASAEDLPALNSSEPAKPADSDIPSAN